MRWLHTCGAALTWAALGWAGHATADTREAYGAQPFTERLAAQGIELKAGYTSEDFRSVGHAGPSVGAHAGQLSVSSIMDLDRLWGLPDAELHVDVSYRDGMNIQERGVATLLQSQEVHGRGQTWRLSGLWLGKKLLDGRLDIKAGRLTVGAEFGDLECTFSYQGLCGTLPGAINGNYWYNWPISQWAATTQVRMPRQTSVKMGVYQVNPALLERGHRFTLNPSGTTGILVPVEFAWAPMHRQRRASYKVGGWYTSAPVRGVGRPSQVSPDTARLSGQMESSAYGTYVIAEQQLSGGAGEGDKAGLRGFVTLALSDRKTSALDRTAAVAAIYRGVSAVLPQDEIGIGLSFAHVNRALQREQALLFAGGTRELPPDSSEYALEVFYAWQATRWLRLQPDAQLIHHSGRGAANRADYVVAGVKTVIQF